MLNTEIPVVTLEMRIQPMVRQMVAQMLVTEQDVQARLESAAREAIARFDFDKVIEEAVTHEVPRILTDAISTAVRHALWDEGNEILVKKRIAKVLSGEDH